MPNFSRMRRLSQKNGEVLSPSTTAHRDFVPTLRERHSAPDRPLGLQFYMVIGTSQYCESAKFGCVRLSATLFFKFLKTEKK